MGGVSGRPLRGAPSARDGLEEERQRAYHASRVPAHGPAGGTGHAGPAAALVAAVLDNREPRALRARHGAARRRPPVRKGSLPRVMAAFANLANSVLRLLGKRNLKRHEQFQAAPEHGRGGRVVDGELRRWPVSLHPQRDRQDPRAAWRPGAAVRTRAGIGTPSCAGRPPTVCRHRVPEPRNCSGPALPLVTEVGKPASKPSVDWRFRTLNLRRGQMGRLRGNLERTRPAHVADE